MHHEFEELTPVDVVADSPDTLTFPADQAPQPRFLPDQDDVGALFILAARDRLPSAPPAMQLLFGVGSSDGRRITLKTVPLDMQQKAAGDRLTRVDSAGWQRPRLLPMLNAAANGGDSLALHAYAILRSSTAEGSARWYVMHVASPIAPERVPQ